jgi:hypothetical protein
MVILAFIFFTPKTWFENKDMTHRPVLVTIPSEGTDLSRDEIELRVRSVTGSNKTEVLGIRPRRNAEGKLIVYEVDIR